MTPVIQKQ